MDRTWARAIGGCGCVAAVAALAASAGCFTPADTLLAAGKVLGHRCSSRAECPAPLDCVRLSDSADQAGDGGCVHL
jgi:hypothetical protein